MFLEKESFTTEIILYGSENYRKALDLRNNILRTPLGLDLYQEDLSNESHYFHLGLFLDQTLAAVLVLIPLNPHTLQMRQVSVLEDFQNQHLGKTLIQYAETFALQKGFGHLVLNARQTATIFYQKQGYTIIGTPFLEMNILHQKMKKELLQK